MLGEVDALIVEVKPFDVHGVGYVEGLHFDYERIHLSEHRPSLPQGA